VVEVRDATSADARAIATVHVTSWRAAYRGLLPDRFLDRLSVDERAPTWRRRIDGRHDAEAVLVAERDGAVVGFLAAIPIYARPGWFFEDFLRDPDAPNGTVELLVDAGMRAAAEVKPDVAVIDIGLPGADGYEVASSLRRDPENQKMVLVAITGFEQPDSLRRAREAGFDEYLTKPVRPDRLVRLIDAAHASRSRRTAYGSSA
jgi:CheY-like chemotaxis protein